MSENPEMLQILYLCGVKKLGFGLMRLPLTDSADLSAVGMSAAQEMVDSFLAKGFTYFDTAYQYHLETSESILRELVVKRYPREAYTVTDKMPCWEVHKTEDLERIFNLQLERTGLEYFDWYLLHAMNKSYVELMDKVGGWDFLKKKKEEGRVRHIGFSFHDDSATLEKILKSHPEMEYVQLQINYIDWNSPSVESGNCYRLCEKYGKRVFVMEPIKGGSLAKVPPQVEEIFREVNPHASVASWAIRFAASLPNVDMVLSGMSNMEQVQDNTGYMADFKSFDDKEWETVMKAAETIQNSIRIPCTACNYCWPKCPKKIAIPEYFAMINSLQQFGAYQHHNTLKYYELLTQKRGKASDCIGCGQCEARCPQHIPIIEKLKLVARIYESEQSSND